MKIAIVGTGIAGNVAAYRLRREHDITVFEANDYIGGHTNTVEVEEDGRTLCIDTGFIVFNDRTYPNFIALLDELGQASRRSVMSFSVQSASTGLEYNGSNLNGLFSQRLNLLRPSFVRMVRDILRFNREAVMAIQDLPAATTVGEYLGRHGYSEEFARDYLVPMTAAIWSAEPVQVVEMPLAFLVRFFHNHGLLQLKDRPVWHVIEGGSREYVRKLTTGHRDRIRTATPVESISRFGDHVQIKARGCEAEQFDHVFIACHSDQALRMLADPTDAEREILGAIPYQRNEAVLHTDVSLMPRRRRTWAAWNYHIPAERRCHVSVTYNMNMLQGLDAKRQYCVTLNNTAAIDPAKIIYSVEYDHPVFKLDTIEAQSRHREINTGNMTSYCGAYWRNGFHEDGVYSALKALSHFEEDQKSGELRIRRAS
jgi:predicted NAD/FAD-binding protein